MKVFGKLFGFTFVNILNVQILVKTYMNFKLYILNYYVCLCNILTVFTNLVNYAIVTIWNVLSLHLLNIMQLNSYKFFVCNTTLFSFLNVAFTGNESHLPKVDVNSVSHYDQEKKFSFLKALKSIQELNGPWKGGEAKFYKSVSSTIR